MKPYIGACAQDTIAPNSDFSWASPSGPMLSGPISVRGLNVKCFLPADFKIWCGIAWLVLQYRSQYTEIL